MAHVVTVSKPKQATDRTTVKGSMQDRENI